MKRLEDIQDLTSEQLGQIAADESVRVPDGLAAGAALAAGLAEAPRRPAARRLAVPAAVLAAAALLLAVLLPSRAPKDTFDDPLLAYAAVEQAFQYISTQMNKGLDIAREAEPVIEKTLDAIQ